MSRTWFAQPLETVATWWRVLRRDGVALGFISHDRDRWFDGVLHRAAPGMVPSALRRSAGLDEDSAEVAGALAHDAISAVDLAAGRYDGARIRIGLIDWETGERETIWVGTLGAVTEEDDGFTAELASRKTELLQRQVPRTSPGCRAIFCGPECGLSAALFTHEAMLTSVDWESGVVTLASDVALADLVGGTLRPMDGAQAGAILPIRAIVGGSLLLDSRSGARIDAGLEADLPAIVREGCDHRLDTCADRFANAANFRGEPFLPGNDLLVRYPAPSA